MRSIPPSILAYLAIPCAALGAIAGFAACADALHLDPPGTGGPQDGGAEGGPSCRSNPDCPYPTPVCDTVRETCVQCLVIQDCAGTPGSVCSMGSCLCPSQGNPGMVGPCASTAWKATTTQNAPEGRSHHVAVWTGSKMVVWGGKGGGSNPLNTGGVYDPAKNVWTPTSVPAGLQGRYDATAVWDDADGLMLVWGGVGAKGLLDDGWRYHPADDTWSQMAQVNPAADAGPADAGSGFAARANHSAVWATGLSGPGMTKAAMIVWGGITDLMSGTTTDDGQIYDPAKDKWVGGIPSGSGPSPRAFHSAVWSTANGYMLVFGGASAPTTLADNATYDFTPGGSWNMLSSTPPPGARQKHTGVWDPATMKMLVWGGADGAASMYFQDGQSLDTSNTWLTFGGSGPMPEGRVDHTSVILAGAKGSQLVIFGGDDGSTIFDKGWSLDTSPSGVWSPLPTPGPTPRKNHTAVATASSPNTPGSSMIVWGGETAAGVYSNEGWVYTPQ